MSLPPEEIKAAHHRESQERLRSQSNKFLKLVCSVSQMGYWFPHNLQPTYSILTQLFEAERLNCMFVLQQLNRQFRILISHYTSFHVKLICFACITAVIVIDKTFLISSNQYWQKKGKGRNRHDCNKKLFMTVKQNMA